MPHLSRLHINRIERFSDTDAEGEIHFQKLLEWSHLAWDESLERFGLEAG
jgi:1,4-dihydroxy-2-naphthoyl-CoA hydrolase